MVSLDRTLTLPDDIAQETQERGLLTPEAVEQLIRTEIQRRRTSTALLSVMGRLAAVDMPPMTDDEVQAEIDAVRAARRATRARGT